MGCWKRQLAALWR